MSVNSYLENIISYLRMLIDENKLHDQKIQLDKGFNMKEELHTFHVPIM